MTYRMTPFPMEGCNPSIETMMRLNDDLRRELEDKQERIKVLSGALREAIGLITEEYTRAAMANGYWPTVKPIVERLDAVLDEAKPRYDDVYSKAMQVFEEDSLGKTSTAFQCPKCKSLFEDDPKIQDPPGVLCPECCKKGDPVGVCHRVVI